EHNQPLAPERRVEFRGLDIYSLSASMAEVLGYLNRADPRQARLARQRYACLTPWQDEPALHGHLVERDHLVPCEHAVVEQLNSLLTERLACYVQDDEAFFDAAQN